MRSVKLIRLQGGEVKVSVVYCVRNLGAWFNANMNMSTHINSVCQAIYYHIRCIRNYLSYDNRKSIVQAIIMPRLDYYERNVICSAVFEIK